MRGLIIIFLILISYSGFASEKDLYNFLWLDPDKSVYVLQKKIHEKKNKNYIQFGYTKGISTDFQDTNGYNINIGRFLHEEWAIELQFAQYINKNDNAYESIIRVNNTEPFIRKMLQSVGMMGIWSPFYGKINTFNKIYYFDISFGLGIAHLITESNLNYVQNTTAIGKFDNEVQTAMIAKTDIKVYIDENFYIQSQLYNHTYWANEPQNPKTDKVKFNFDFTLGLGYSF